MNGIHCRDPLVSDTGNSFDVSRILGRIAEGLPQLVDRGVEPVLEIDESIISPNLLAQFIAADDMVGAFEQGHQDLERLLLDLDPDTMLPQLSGYAVNFEGAKSRVFLRLRMHDAQLSIGPITRFIRGREPCAATPQPTDLRLPERLDCIAAISGSVYPPRRDFQSPTTGFR